MDVAKLRSRLKAKVSKMVTAPIQISKMKRSGDPFLCAMGDAIAAHQRGELSDDEKQELSQIEALRAELCESRERISVLDYGVGNPEDALSAETMARGRITTKIVGEACRQNSKTAQCALLLFHVIRKMKPLKCIELGTCLGISAAYEGAALKLNRAGALVTLEGAPAFARIAERNLELLGLRSRVSVRVGRFNDILAKVLADAQRVDYAFIDGHHDEWATIDYFERFLPYLSTRAIVVFDDIDWSTGMVRAWRRASTHPSVDIAIDLGKMGVCLFGVKAKSRYRLMIN